MAFDCIVSAIETKICGSFSFECTLRTAFIEYLKERHDLLMYNHGFLYGLKHLDPTEIAMQLVNHTPSSLYFCELTMFLLMDALNLKGTLLSPVQSTSSYRFQNQNTLCVTQSDIVCIVADRKIYIMDCDVIKLSSCPIMDYVTRRYSQYMYQLDVLPMPSTHVLGLHGAGRLFSD